MRTLVIGPHPDDELLGCGGTLLRRASEGGTVGWLLMTKIPKNSVYSDAQIREKESEIEVVREGLGISKSNLFRLDFPTSGLDQQPLSSMVSRVADVFGKFLPEEIFLPHPGDAHSDHRITFEVASSCAKWFRCPTIKRILIYETLSETDVGSNPFIKFNPTVFIDVSNHIEGKLSLMRNYKSELGDFPFPRSEEALRALATFRGAQSGFIAAEAFAMLKERQS